MSHDSAESIRKDGGGTRYFTGGFQLRITVMGEDVVAALSKGSERNGVPVGRPDWLNIRGRIGRKATEKSARPLKQPKIEVASNRACEGHLSGFTTRTFPVG